MEKINNICYTNSIKRGDFMPKVPRKINKVINEFIEKVEQTLGKRAKKIILYGSYARRRF